MRLSHPLDKPSRRYRREPMMEAKLSQIESQQIEEFQNNLEAYMSIGNMVYFNEI